MNEVLYTLEDLGLQVHYSDTDSMIMPLKNMKPLAEEFRKRYNRELIGKALGQFHDDLETF